MLRWRRASSPIRRRRSQLLQESDRHAVLFVGATRRRTNPLSASSCSSTKGSSLGSWREQPHPSTTSVDESGSAEVCEGSVIDTTGMQPVGASVESIRVPSGDVRRSAIAFGVRGSSCFLSAETV
jgi:hypothetical protein